MNSISKKIVQGRKEKRYNQKDFAGLIGVSQPSLIKYEKGETDLIPIGVAKAIAETLEVSFTELFEVESGASRRNELLDAIEILEAQVKKLEKELADREDLIDYFKSKYKEYYTKQKEYEFTEMLSVVSELYAALQNFKSSENVDAYKKQLVLEKQFIKDTVEETRKEGVLSEFELLEILYQCDHNVTAIVEGEQGLVAERLSRYWGEFMDVSSEKVEQFLLVHQRKWNTMQRINRKFPKNT